MAGGLLSGVIVNPWELIMVQQQRFGGSLWSTMHRIVSGHPILLTRGMLPAMCREAIFTIGYLGLTPILEQYQKQRQHDSFISKFGCAMFSGGISTVLSHPFDTCKTCMQGDLSRTHFGGLRQTFYFLYSKYGLRRIYGGVSFRFGIVAMSFFVFNRIIEHLSPILYGKQDKPMTSLTTLE